MNELIKITAQSDGTQAVSARELYDFLGYDSKNWSRWYQKNIEDNEFAIENVDFQTFVIERNGNETKDFALSIDFSKKLSMIARTDKGEQARQYFISCEKKLKELSTPTIISSPSITLSHDKVVSLMESIMEVASKEQRLELTSKLLHGVKPSERNLELEMIAKYIYNGSDTFMTTTEIKAFLEKGTGAIVNLRKLGMGLKAAGFVQTSKWINKTSRKGYNVGFKTVSYE